MLKEKLKDKHIILASGSPRRQQFFEEIGLDFEVRLKAIEEVFPDHLQAEEITDYLAELKASAFNGELKENEILFTSDTIVWLEGKALGKPKGHKGAVEMLRSLSGKIHQVITSVCVKTTAKTEVFHDITHVTFATLSDEVIEYYIEHYQPFDKAGSYGIQEWIGLVGIEKIEGSYANVVGLPTQKVFEYLNRL